MSPFPRRAVSTLLGTLALAAVAAPTAFAQPVHQVVSGESLWQVAALNGMSPAALAAANGLSADAGVQAGQTLTIPPQTATPAAATPAATTAAAPAAVATSSTPSSASGSAYVVQPGDNLSQIAAQQGVSVASIAAANGLTVDGVLPAGRSLSLPAAGSATAATTTTTAASSPSTGSSPASPAAAAPASGHLSAEQIGSIATENGVAPSLARAIAWQESGFDNAAISSVGARGVMQVMPGTWDWIGRNLTSSPLDPSSATDNVRAGTLYLKHLLQETGGDPDQAAAGYYQGLASVRSRGQYDDTQQYVQNVQALRARFGD